ncbi:MAG TPA: aminopeptidase, partial [Bryobacterales bacterium]|nr:aminopeptidase [Bryobacterales bacterium]
FAREKFGPASPISQNLSREPELFLQKAHIVNRYQARLTRLYAAARAGEITKQDALAKKQALFDRLHADCMAIAPEPSSFSPCPGAANNAGLAFDFTYTKHYPLLYEVFLSQGRDVRRTISAVKQALAAGAASEDQAVKTFHDLIGRQKPGAPGDAFALHPLPPLR